MDVQVNRFIGYIAANVRRLRERAGMTQEELAEASDLAWTYVQRIEQGRANPSVRIIVQLATALKTTPQRLFRKTTPVVRKRGRPKKRKA